MTKETWKNNLQFWVSITAGLLTIYLTFLTLSERAKAKKQYENEAIEELN